MASSPFGTSRGSSQPLAGYLNMSMRTTLNSVVFCLLTCCWAASVTAENTALIRIKGSDTMFFVAQAWSEGFQLNARDVAISVGGGGSGTGFHAMLNGSVDLVNASRRISRAERERAQRLGMNPVEHVVGLDALAVYLHKDNPLPSISFKQLAGIYGRGAKIRKWSDLGIEVPGCRDQEIVRAGRQNSSGTYFFFRSQILTTDSNYDLGILDMLGSRDVVHLVEKTPCAIGYSGLAYATPRVKLACVASGMETACVRPSIRSASDRSYPMARPLFMYSKDEPRGRVKAYLDWILSDEGQCIIKKNGYAPIRPIDCG